MGSIIPSVLKGRKERVSAVKGGRSCVGYDLRTLGGYVHNYQGIRVSTR